MPFVVRYFSYTSVIFCVDNQWQYTDHVNIIVLVHCLVVAGEKSRRIINSSPLLRWQAHIIQCSTLFVSWQLETFIARSGQPKPERRICKEWMWREYGERKHRMETKQSHHRMVPFCGYQHAHNIMFLSAIRAAINHDVIPVWKGHKYVKKEQKQCCLHGNLVHDQENYHDLTVTKV